MANWDNLKRAVSNIVKTNGNQEITGANLQQVLINIISNIGDNIMYKGIAVPTTNPGAPDGPVFYFAFKNGIYSNFSNIEVFDKPKMLIWNNSAWSSEEIDFVTADAFNNLARRINNIKLEEADSSEQSIVVGNSLEDYTAIIKDKQVDIKGSLRKNGAEVLTSDDASGLATIDDVNKKQDIIKNFSQELSEEEEESIVFEDDNTKEIFASVSKRGILSKGLHDVKYGVYGSSIRIFGGSVSWLLDKYEGGNLIREKLGVTLLDSGVSGAGFINNMVISDNTVTYTGANIQHAVDEATAPGQTAYDMYILWASTNDLTLISDSPEKLGTYKDYTPYDGFNIEKRGTQCGAINYCIKKLQDFSPSSKIIIFGSLKVFKSNGDHYNPQTVSLDGVFKEYGKWSARLC